MSNRFMNEDEDRCAKGGKGQDENKKFSKRRELRRQKREGWR